MRRASLVTLAAALSIFTLSGSAVADRAPVPKMLWGPALLPNGKSAFPIYHRLGVQVWQVELLWDEVALSRPVRPEDPRDPGYSWPAALDSAAREAKHYGIKVCVLVQHTPAWANGGKPNIWAPSHAGDYGAFMTAAARRYPSVHDWMVWGEPNRGDTFLPMPDNSPVGPRRYALLLDSAYHALKAVSKANVVIGGDTMTLGAVPPPDFIRWMRLPSGKRAPLDDWGHNPYSPRTPNLSQRPYFPGARDINDLDTLEAQLAQTYKRPVRLWVSEYSISSDHKTRAFAFFVSRQRQARFLTAAFRLANAVSYVAGMGWFDLLDETTTVPRNLTNGLMTWDLKPKPAYYAFQRVR